MRRALAATVIAACVAVVGGCAYTPQGVQPVQGFDVKRYMGRWYEIARLDHRFERGLERVTATYALQPDGTVQVVNRGFDIRQGEWREARGVAKFTGRPDVGALKVSFFGPFYGGYNIVDLDAAYENALVVGPSRSYLWILSRAPDPPPETVARLKRRAAELGYDTSALVDVRH